MATPPLTTWRFSLSSYILSSFNLHLASGIKELNVIMSRQAKAFFGASVAVSAATIWGVHYIQQRESDVRRSIFVRGDLNSPQSLPSSCILRSVGSFRAR